jgi:hypothetical protein
MSLVSYALDSVRNGGILMPFRARLRANRKRSKGQSLVEFSLILVPFLTCVIAICEFTFLFSAFLCTSFSVRDGVQIAAELGNTGCADHMLLARIESDMTPPAFRERIQKVEIYWSDTAGNVKGGAINTWRRSGNSSCTAAGGTTYTVPYSQSTNSYALGSRCNIVSGATCTSGHSGVDTIAVRITYQHDWVTPLPNLVGLGGGGDTIVQTALMRLEPVK